MTGMLFPIVAAAFLVLAPSTTAPSTDRQQHDMTLLRSRLIRSVIPDDATVVESLKSEATKHAATLRADGSWADIDYADEERSFWKAQGHAQRVLSMSKGYGITEDAELLKKTLAALDYWLEKDFQNPNWWQNQIGTPQLVGESAVLLGREHVSGERRAKVDRIMARSTWAKWIGQNLIWGVTNQVLRGLVNDDAAMITQAYDRFYHEIAITNGEGIQADASFHQHRAQFYSGSYGQAFAIDVARYTAIAWGTPWQIPPDKLDVFNRFMLDGQRWMMFGDVFDYSAKGREIVRPGLTHLPRDWTGGPITPRGAAYSLLNAVKLLADQPVPRQMEYQAWLKALAGDAAAPPLVGNRHFWRSDYMVHRGGGRGWMASVRMFSDRLINTELVNDEGKRSHHLADGASLLYIRGDEYADIFPAWDWTKVPGTTAEQGSLDFEDGKEIGVKGRTGFVGGVSDGTCGLAAMDLSRGKLHAKKAWFFVDGAYLCLGAGITCDSPRDVATSVNQCRLRGEVKQAANWIHHADVGYILAHRDDVQLTTAKQAGDWTDIGVGAGGIEADVFNLWIDHGSRPKDADYAYVVYPSASAAQTAAKAANPDVQIIANTAKQQAAWHQRLGIVAAAFFEAGSIQVGGSELRVDRPCLVLVRDGAVSISNPQNERLVVNVTLAGVTMKVDLPGGERAGATVTVSTVRTPDP